MKSIAHDKGESIFTLQKEPAEVFYIKKTVVKNFATFTGKHFC